MLGGALTPTMAARIATPVSSRPAELGPGGQYGWQYGSVLHELLHAIDTFWTGKTSDPTPNVPAQLVEVAETQQQRIRRQAKANA